MLSSVSGASINWVAAPGCWLLDGAEQAQPLAVARPLGTVEVTTAADGYKAGASKALVAAGKAQSRICRAALAQEAVQSMRQMREVYMPARCLNPDSNGGMSTGAASLQQEEHQRQQEQAECHGVASLVGQLQVQHPGREISEYAVGSASNGDQVMLTTLGVPGTPVPDQCAEMVAEPHAVSSDGHVYTIVAPGADPAQPQSLTRPGIVKSYPVTTYQSLKQLLAGRYLTIWQRLKLQQPFRLWISKPAHLQTFEVEGLEG